MKPFRDLQSWDGYATAISYPIPNGYGATATCGSSIISCQIPTYSVCDQYISHFQTFDVEDVGVGANPYATEQIALAQCKIGDPKKGRAWAIVGEYDPNDPGGPGSCVPTDVMAALANTPCY
jgi:hypothetical protein